MTGRDWGTFAASLLLILTPTSLLFLALFR